VRAIIDVAIELLADHTAFVLTPTELTAAEVAGRRAAQG
jgi:hypothetical protein